MYLISNSIVFTQGDRIVRVAPSCQGKYKHANDTFPASGTRPQVVYHKVRKGKHCFRLANSNDTAHPENSFGHFYTSPLVGWDSWPSTALRDKMLSTWNSSVGPKLDIEFPLRLRLAADDHLIDFNPWEDE